MGTINQNQFKKSALPGQIDLNSGGLNTSFTMRIDPDSSETDIAPGTPLEVVDGGANDENGVPYVDVPAANTDIPFGARIYGLKNGLAQPGDIVQVSYNGVIQWMEAAGALNRWAEVSTDIANPGQVKAKSTDALFGRLLDKAFASGDLVRVLVNTGPV